MEEGDTLYHYTSAEGLQGIFGGEFWITESRFLNDISEFHVATDIFIEVIERNINNVTTKEKIKDAIYEELNLLMCNDEMLDEKSYSFGH